jgi:hypothetical protein
LTFDLGLKKNSIFFILLIRIEMGTIWDSVKVCSIKKDIIVVEEVVSPYACIQV